MSAIQPMYEGIILNRCTIAQENICDLSEEGFALARRDGVGASDSSAILGTMSKFRGVEDVLNNKLEKEYSDAEREIGKKPAVRKGRDLESLILAKAAQALDCGIWKSPNMYRLIDYPHLTINYDGLALLEDELVPIEAKLVTIYGDKYYNFTSPNEEKIVAGPAERLDQLLELATWHGIPPYYLIQVQQQLMGTNASYAYLSALRDKDWTLYLFKIPAYEWVQTWIAVETYQFWNRVERARRAS